MSTISTIIIFFLIAIIFGFVGIMMWIWIIKAVAGKGKKKGNTTASAILKERYAKGEITQEEFETKKKLMS